ncbi:MAG: malonyl-CoA decarboxylase [Gemmatimonadetes bacterium]|nr:malonyl-CoA decarboxylase [Gemmatimonadota bacterium]
MTVQKKSSLLDRAFRNLRGVWRKIARAYEDFSEVDLSPDLSGGDRARLIGQMRACLEARGGEVSARSRAAALGQAYLALNETGHKVFLCVLAEEFDVDHTRVDRAVAGLQEAASKSERELAETELKSALEAPRVTLLTQFNALPEGVKFLVDLRAELISLLGDVPELKGLESDLKTLLTSWFDVGFLDLRQITWNAPAQLLEKLIAYEAVHEIQSWDDLKNRLASDRRCFAFFHPRMPDEPLIFVWVALVRGMADNVQVLLDARAPQEDAEAADTAVFYSISNAQPGLRGIPIGSFLIKRVVDRLTGELNGLKTFATLSPVPGFRAWLDKILTEEGAEQIDAAEGVGRSKAAGVDYPLAAIRRLLARPNWFEDDKASDPLRGPLLRLCARYLIEERRPRGTTLDSVAHFHSRNGARLERLNWLADRSERGITQSAGIMINYVYELDKIDAFHEAYTGRGEVTTSREVDNLLKA